MTPDRNPKPGPSGRPPTTKAETPALRSKRAWAVFLSIAVLALIADLWSKDLAFRFVHDRPVVVEREAVLELGPRRLNEIIDAQTGYREPVVVVPHILELTLVLNPGAVFGIGAGQRWIFVFFTLIAMGFVTWAFGTWTHAKQWPAHACAGLLVGGGLGNLYDRLVFACVRDFLHPLPTATIPGTGGRPLWPYVSNVADALLIVGIFGLVLFAWFGGPQPARERVNFSGDAPSTDAPNEDERRDDKGAENDQA